MDATKTRGVTMDVTNEEERASSSHVRLYDTGGPSESRHF